MIDEEHPAPLVRTAQPARAPQIVSDTQEFASGLRLAPAGDGLVAAVVTDRQLTRVLISDQIA